MIPHTNIMLAVAPVWIRNLF